MLPCPEQNYVSLDAIMRVILVENSSKRTTMMQFSILLRHAKNWNRHIAPPKEVAKWVSLCTSSLCWHSHRSCDAIVTQKCGKQRVTSQCIFGGSNFKISFRCFRSIFRRQTLKRGILGAVVCENMSVKE